MKRIDIFDPSVDVIRDATSSQRNAHLYEVAERICCDGLILEFGVMRGFTARIIADRIKPRTLYAFDWFKGQPHDVTLLDGQHLPKGWGAQDVSTLYLFNNIKLVIGDIFETLPDWLVGHEEAVAFCHIDLDFYDITKFILDQLTPRMQHGTIIAFDEFYDQRHAEDFDEFKAFNDWTTQHNIDSKIITRASGQQQAAVQIL
jgi:predicted O-methyltransferase YrrM